MKEVKEEKEVKEVKEVQEVQEVQEVPVHLPQHDTPVTAARGEHALVDRVPPDCGGLLLVAPEGLHLLLQVPAGGRGQQEGAAEKSPNVE